MDALAQPIDALAGKDYWMPLPFWHMGHEKAVMAIPFEPAWRGQVKHPRYLMLIQTLDEARNFQREMYSATNGWTAFEPQKEAPNCPSV